MDPEIKEMLKVNIELTKENHELLRKIRRVQKWQQTTKTIYWVVIILIAFGAYYYVKPYIGKIDSLYQSAAKNLQEFESIGKSFSGFSVK